MKRNYKTNWNNKNIITFYTAQLYDSIICGYVCVGFLDFMLKGRSLLEYTNFFLVMIIKKNDKTVL